MSGGRHFKERNTKKKKNKFFVGNCLLILFIILLIISFTKIVRWHLENEKNKQISKEISNSITIETTEEGETKYNIDFNKLKQQNSETVAYLKVNGTNIDYVVVKANDNDYYLKHNFNKEYNGAGWVFADCRLKFDGTDKNLVIYGHNMRDGSMFGTMKNALNSQWYNNKENLEITLVTELEECKYQIFSIYQVEKEEYYTTTDFRNKEEFKNFIQNIKGRSIKDFNVEVTDEDSILTLSTCANNNKYRVVIHAKKL